MRLVVVLAPLLVACAPGPTSVLVRITDGDQGPPPSSITVDVFQPHGRIADATLATPSWPGSLMLRGLPAVAEELRVVVRGGKLLGGERVQIQPHAQATVDVALHASRLDSDGDGVPDDLDDCPFLYDPLQDAVSCDGDGGAGPPDQGQDGTVAVPSSCPAANGVFCDGFEDPALAAHWTNNNLAGPSSYALDSTRAYRGSQSLKVHHDAVVPNTIASAAVGETETFPATDFFVRAFLYIPSPLVGVNEAMLFALQSVAPYNEIALENDDQGNAITYSNLATPTTYQASTTMFPLDRWFCVEWEVVATQSGTSRLWLDGAEVTAVEVPQNLAGSPPIGLVQLGVSVYRPSVLVPAHDVWFDEVMIDGARIGCAR